MLDYLLCFALYEASMAVTRTYKPLLDERASRIRSTSSSSHSGMKMVRRLDRLPIVSA
jgi:hypothetical protein